MSAIRFGPLRVVLFGPTGTGKTALLTALTESAPGNGRNPPEFLDCDSRLAEVILEGDLTSPGPDEASLAYNIVHTDVLILTLDAVAPPERLDELFALADRFLKTLEEIRGSRTAVSGLPVFLVLTRCDLLARPGDTLMSWLERIEERKRGAEGRFRDFLGASNAPRDGAFGAIDLRLWATASKRPSLPGSPAAATGTFGVADLYRQVLDEGLAYRAIKRRSNRRLVLAVASVGGLVLMLVVLCLGLFLHKEPAPRSLLERRIETLQFSDRSAASQRLDASAVALAARLSQFDEIHADPGFTQLPEEDRAFVLLRADELQHYLKLRDLVLALMPSEANSLEELDTTRSALAAIALPADWASTTVAQERARALDEADRLRQAAERAGAWFDLSSAEASAMLRGDQYRGRAIAWSEWYQAAEALLQPAAGPGSRPAPRPEDPIEGTQGLHMALVLSYSEVVQKAAAWSAKKKQLDQAAALAVELGLVRIPGHKQSLLSFDEEFRLDGADRRLEELKTSAPQLLESGLGFASMELGQALRAEFDIRAREQYNVLLGLERQVLRARFRKFDTGGEESPERWAYVAEGLPPADEVPPPWVKLAAILARIQEPPASTSPMADLAAFLKKESFPIWARTLRLEIPASVGNRPLPGAQLRITIGRRKSAATEVMVFDLIRYGGTPQTPTFVFERKDHASVLYFPGDTLRAELVLDNGQQFTWKGSRTTSYQFEAIFREPWKHRERSPAEEGSQTKFVRLAVMDVAPPGQPEPWPSVPDLLPDVR